jgi:hypothetical protein
LTDLRPKRYNDGVGASFKTDREPLRMNRDRILAMVVGAVGVAAMAAFGPAAALAQQANIATPSVASGDSFFENYGLNFGYSKMGRNGGFFFNNGGGGVVPPFGGFDPSAGANFGLGGNIGGGRFFMNGTASQGSNRSMVSQTPSVTLMNGQIGTITDTVQFPFVTSILPVVGDPVSPLAEKLERLQNGEAPARQSTAAAAAPATFSKEARPQVSTAAVAPTSSVAAIRRRQQLEDAAHAEAAAAEISELVARGEAAERAEKPRVARSYFVAAAKLAFGEHKKELLARAAANE